MTFGCNVKRGKKKLCLWTKPEIPKQCVIWLWGSVLEPVCLGSNSGSVTYFEHITCLFMPLFLHTKLRVIIVHMESLYKIIRKSNWIIFNFSSTLLFSTLESVLITVFFFLSVEKLSPPRSLSIVFFYCSKQKSPKTDEGRFSICPSIQYLVESRI